MPKKVKLSFCIAVYNQKELVEKCVESIVEYHGNDVEIIISDDNSIEEFIYILDKFKDDRIKYYKNSNNVGHDRNILQAIKYAEGEYVCILRSRDRIYAGAIPEIIDILNKNECAYMVTSSFNEKGTVNLDFRDKVYTRGKKALDAHFKLFVHPSGNIYKRKYIDIERLNHFLNDEHVSKLGFIVHNLIRISLAEKGDFITSSVKGWIYTTTENSKDFAVNCDKNKKSIYASEYVIQRFIWESHWNLKNTSEKYKIDVIFSLIRFYLFQITWNMKLSNENVKLRRHYNYEKTKVSVLDEQKKFKKVCIQCLEKEYGLNINTYETILNHIFKDNVTKGACKFLIMKTMEGSTLYVVVSNLYKKYIRGL